MQMTNEEKEFYLMLCGWNYVKSAPTNPFWQGRNAWFCIGYHEYLTTDQAYEIEKVNNAYN